MGANPAANQVNPIVTDSIFESELKTQIPDQAKSGQQESVTKSLNEFPKISEKKSPSEKEILKNEGDPAAQVMAAYIPQAIQPQPVVSKSFKNLADTSLLSPLKSSPSSSSSQVQNLNPNFSFSTQPGQMSRLPQTPGQTGQMEQAQLAAKPEVPTAQIITPIQERTPAAAQAARVQSRSPKFNPAPQFEYQADFAAGPAIQAKMQTFSGKSASQKPQTSGISLDQGQTFANVSAPSVQSQQASGSLAPVMAAMQGPNSISGQPLHPMTEQDWTSWGAGDLPAETDLKSLNMVKKPSFTQNLSGSDFIKTVESKKAAPFSSTVAEEPRSRRSLDSMDQNTMMPLGHHLRPNESGAQLNSLATKEVSAQVTQGAGAKDRVSRESLIQISNQIQTLSSFGGGEMRIRLKPEHLGELHVRVVAQGSNVGIHFQASDEKAKKIIEDSISYLKESLGAQKLNLSQVDLSVQQPTFSNHQQMDAQSNSPAFEMMNLDLNQGSSGQSQNSWDSAFSQFGQVRQPGDARPIPRTMPGFQSVGSPGYSRANMNGRLDITA